ncbi:MAG TPA: AgmX/PglI C-terminal domain-containing protein [Polyangiaceae bacterium]|nr:AgmX/PglI C-terminal domain-containing protein [Polyangiaceae bacterium]
MNRRNLGVALAGIAALALALVFYGGRTRTRSDVTVQTIDAAEAPRGSDSSTARNGLPSSTGGAPGTRRDRAAANAIRARLEALRQEAASASSASAAATNRPADASNTRGGNLMPAPSGAGNQAKAELGKYIQKTVREQFRPLASACYEELLTRDPAARGKLELSVVIGGDPSVGGVVESAEALPDSTLKDPSFVTCMVESMMALQFDAPPDDRSRVNFKYPFELSPDPPPPASSR